MDCPRLIAIIKMLQMRYSLLEARIGAVRAARLARHMARGCHPIEEIIWSWAVGVASESTNDPDTLTAVYILLSLFMAEARSLQTDVYGAMQSFWCNWTERCIQKLTQGMVIGDLVFRGSEECMSPKWGKRISPGNGFL